MKKIIFTPLFPAIAISLLLHAGLLLKLDFPVSRMTFPSMALQIGLAPAPGSRLSLHEQRSHAVASRRPAPSLALPTAVLSTPVPQSRAPAVSAAPLPGSRLSSPAVPAPTAVVPSAVNAGAAAASLAGAQGDNHGAGTRGQDSHARYLGDKPAYPEESRRLGEQGRVMLRVVVGVDGQVREVILLRSSGFPRLDQAALTRLRRGPFSPALRAGKAVESVFNLGVPFSLQGD